jgi:hypothetical protein
MTILSDRFGVGYAIYIELTKTSGEEVVRVFDELLRKQKNVSVEQFSYPAKKDEEGVEYDDLSDQWWDTWKDFVEETQGICLE